MIKDLITVMLNDRTGNIEGEWENTQEYQEILKDYKKNYENVKNKLPEDIAFKLIDGLECSFNNLFNSTCKYFYKQGLKDGVKMFKTFKEFNMEFSDETNSPITRSVAIENEYKQMIKENIPTKCLNKEEYIYKKAFEEGRKVGYGQALY